MKFITHCPECGSKLIRFEGEAAHYCPNETACPPQIKGKIEHFISRKAMNIDGLGPETVDMFYRLGLIKDTADLYQLKTDDIKNLERMGEKSAENIVNGIAASKEVPFERVLFALGIRFVGETVAKKIAKSFTDIEELENADLEKLKTSMKSVKNSAEHYNLLLQSCQQRAGGTAEIERSATPPDGRRPQRIHRQTGGPVHRHQRRIHPPLTGRIQRDD